jgi:tetratricopeptide (TPR) repeat protein
MPANSEAFAAAAEHHQAGRLEAAERIYRQILALDEDNADVLSNLGLLFQVTGRVKAAECCFRRALDVKPDLAEAHNNPGTVFEAQHKLDRAIECYRQAIQLKADFAEAYNNLGHVYQCLGKLDEAVHCFYQALQFEPSHAEAHSNLGKVFFEQDKLETAVAHCRRALELKPDFAEALNNLGNALYSQGRLSEANECYNLALKLNPDYARARVNGALLKLLQGNFERGWPEFEWRWKTGQLRKRDFSGPNWDGTPLSGRTILLYSEQGLGDTIQFVRYAPLVKKQNAEATVVVACQKRLLKLLSSCCGIDGLFADGDELPAFDVHAPLLSLPGIFKTDTDTIPANVPYLFADPALVSSWRDKIAELKGYRIGIHWQGREGDIQSRRRDIPLELFTALMRIPGVQLVSLQRGSARAKLSAIPEAIFDPGERFDTSHGGFMDTAAMMKNLDLVITSDTSVSHLAGALGVPVWQALPNIPDWRWLLDRSDSPWYPTMRLFRQKAPGDWSGVFEEIRSALIERIGPGRSV